jgi:hypothetical protein
MTSDSDRMRTDHPPFTQVAHNLLSYSLYLSSTISLHYIPLLLQRLCHYILFNEL